MHVIGGSGHGKTQLLQHLIFHDLTRDEPIDAVVVDSSYGLPPSGAALSHARDASLARTMGMLVGLSALTAFGLYRFHQILGTPVVTDPDLKARIDHLARLVSAAFLQEYREIFSVAAAICVLAALVMFATLHQRLRATAIR